MVNEIFPKGFYGIGLNCGIKKDKMDLAIIYSEKPATAAAVYTNNLLKAAPVKVTKENLDYENLAQVIVVNSGVANAAMGLQGYNDAKLVTEKAAEFFDINQSHVIVASTGVIGVPLPVSCIENGLKTGNSLLKPLAESHDLISNAILTTDTVKKIAQTSIKIKDKEVHFWGMCKGAGMIHPNMSTMLGFILTDAKIDAAPLQKCLSEAVADSFNMISVDGDTSTNDMVAVMANGFAENDVICDSSPDEYTLFAKAIREICISLAKQIVSDGEGATRVFEVGVKHAPSISDAKKIARSICSSSLVKAAIFGRDANWGRIACAAGYSGACYDPEQVDIWIGDMLVSSKGQGVQFDEEEAIKILSEKEVVITLDLYQGDGEAVAWGCDLTYDYVTINADYRS